MKTNTDKLTVKKTKPRMPRRLAATPVMLLTAALLGYAAIGCGCAQDVVAVLSSGSNAYAESLAGFEKEWGKPVPAANMASGGVTFSHDDSMVIAFGAKAATRSYPDSLTLIYWAPGLGIDQIDRAGPAIKICLGARPDILVLNLAEMQPKLKNLGIFFMSDYYTRYIENMRQASHSFGIMIHADKLNRTEELPDRLRAMKTKPDAVLILNDPLFINAQTFAILKNYSWSNGVPLYAPTAGLVEQGATASIGPAFGELGRAAAQTARKVLAGIPAGEEVYPEVNEISVNLTAASKTNITFGEAFLKKVRKVFP